VVLEVGRTRRRFTSNAHGPRFVRPLELIASDEASRVSLRQIETTVCRAGPGGVVQDVPVISRSAGRRDRGRTGRGSAGRDFAAAPSRTMPREDGDLRADILTRNAGPPEIDALLALNRSPYRSDDCKGRPAITFLPGRHRERSPQRERGRAHRQANRRVGSKVYPVRLTFRCSVR